MLLLLLAVILPAAALQTAPGSPCESVCNKQATNTTADEIVCLDRQFNGTDTGSDFQQCVSCQLKSAYSDESAGQTDVDWGLYNLRYAFTSCVFNYPEKVNNISTQCTVACQGLDSALEYDIQNPSGVNFNTWCGASAFADNHIDTCEQCYNLTGNQVYMSNFLEALRYNCHFRTPTTDAFPITPSRIFSESLLPSSTVNLISPSAKPGSGVNLGLVIALPIVAFVIVVAALSVCCFFFVRHRRRKARELRLQGQLRGAQWAEWQAAQAQGGLGGAGGVGSPAMMYGAQQQQQGYGYPYGYGDGMGFVDGDGRGQDVGYSSEMGKKGGFAGMMEVEREVSPEGSVRQGGAHGHEK